MNDASTIAEFFGEPIYTYTRAQALEDGTLIDISKTAAEAGIRFPVAITAAAWSDCVAWSDEDTRRKRVPQDESGRLWDVVWMMSIAIRRMKASRANDTAEMHFQLLRVPREGKGQRPRLATLKATVGPYDIDDDQPAITVMLTHED